MSELTVSQWAAKQGISRQAAYKRIKSGKVHLNEHGLIDELQAETEWLANRDCLQQLRGAPDVRKEPVVAVAPLVIASESEGNIPVGTPVPSNNMPQLAEANAPDSGPCRPTDSQAVAIKADDKAAIAEEQRKILRLKRKALEDEQEVRSGRLVYAEEVEAKVEERARAERDAWLNWPPHISADLAAEFNISERLLQSRLDQEVRKYLAIRSSV